MRPRYLTASAAAVGIGSIAAVSLLPPLHFAYHSAAGRAALETGTMLAALTAALLAAGRLRARANAGDLAVVAGLVLLAAASSGFALMPWALGDGVEARFAWGCTYAGLAGAAMLAAAAILDGRPLARPRLVVGAIAGAFLLAVAAAAVEWPGATLGIDPHRLDVDRLHLSGSPLFLSVQCAAAVLFGVAAVGFTRYAERSDDRFLAWLAAATALAAMARLNYMLFPSLYTDWVFSGDFLRLGTYVLILVGAAGEIRRLQHAAETAVALEERRRIARDFHDGLAQELLYLAYQTRMLARDEPERRDLDLLASAAERAVDESRRAIRTLTKAPEQPFAATLQAEVERAGARYGTETRVRLHSLAEVRPDVAETLVRVAREAVVNAGRHGRARTVRVEMEFGDVTHLRVVDDGEGFDPATVNGSGFGLTSMRERVEAVGGELRVRSAPHAGTEVEVIVP
ncbi:MAG TPA: sensor histidine kinase [Gaiellaceae bacterium]